MELVDPKEQISRFETDQSVRKQTGKPQRQLDETLIAALQSGLPACAGVAVGLDRLHMLNEDSNDIRETLSFAFEVSG